MEIDKDGVTLCNQGQPYLTSTNFDLNGDELKVYFMIPSVRKQDTLTCKINKGGTNAQLSDTADAFGMYNVFVRNTPLIDICYIKSVNKSVNTTRSLIN